MSAPARATPATPASEAPVPHFVLAGLLGLVTFLAFLPTLGNGFVNWDDDRMFVQNVVHRGPLASALVYAWRTRLLGEYMPVTWTSYALDHVTWGLRPFGYHLTSLLLHVATVVAVYFLARRLLACGVAGATPTTGSADSGTELAITLGAASAALVFGLHPMRVEAVAWVAARGTVLGGLLLVLATLVYVRAAARTPPGRGIAPSALCGVAGLFILSLLARATGLVLPMALAVLDVYPLRRLGGDAGWMGRAARVVWMEKVGLALLGVLAFPMGMLARADEGDPLDFRGYDPAVAVANALHGAAHYLVKMVLPVGLSPVYRVPQRDDLMLGWIGASAALVALVTLVVVAARRRWPAALCAWAINLVLVAPTSGLVPRGRLRGAVDRYTYTACLGWAVVAGAGLAAAWLSDRRAGCRGIGRTSLAGVAALLMVWAGLSWRQLDVWRDGVHLWQRAVAVTPSSGLAHNNLGMALAAVGDQPGAAREFAAAARRWSDVPGPYLNLGRVLAAQGRMEEATEAFRMVVWLVPSDAHARVGLGTALWARGEGEAALAELQVAVRLNPDLPLARYQLALLLDQLGRRPEAVRHMTRAVDLVPGNVEARQALDRLTSPAPPGGPPVSN